MVTPRTLGDTLHWISSLENQMAAIRERARVVRQEQKIDVRQRARDADPWVDLGGESGE